MSCTQFVGNLEGLNNGQDFPKELLKVDYYGYCANTELPDVISNEPEQLYTWVTCNALAYSGIPMGIHIQFCVLYTFTPIVCVI